MAKNNNLTDFLTDVANAIRTKKGTSALIDPQNFSDEIASIETGGDVSVESVDNGDGTQTLVIYEGDDSITNTNISTYKFQDMVYSNLSTGALATNEEYEQAEEYLQPLYNSLMNGGGNE